ncbi:MAG TPA: class I SAM-dependent methyltransferase, partial [Stellaceae bacterium]|nr:class I SAM-dependent methyltransferase [Stellaceae bacterium]
MELIRPVDWVSDDKFIVDGLEFSGDLGSYEQRTTEDRVVILKNSSLLRQYLDFFKPHSVRNLFEFGIWQGGSPLFYGLATDAEKIVAVDIANPPPALDKIIAKHRLADKVKLHFRTSQDDRAAVTAIVDKEFGDEPIDVVIDDASHQHGFTRRAFEIIYPRLRTGGIYIIEDWQWAHIDSPRYQKGEHFGGEPALTNFI